MPPSVARVQRLVVALLGDDRGDTAVQYALIASLISTFLIGAFIAFGNAQNAAFEKWTDAVGAAIGSGGGGGGDGG
jgi:Flp pilus assembly pilin Flp